MDDNTLTILTALAAKLGTTADALWGVLLRQAPINGVIDLLRALLMLAVMVGAFWFIHQNTKRVKEPEGWKNARWDAEVGVLAWTVTVILSLVSGIFILADLKEAAVSLLSPDYWALQQVLTLLKK